MYMRVHRRHMVLAVAVVFVVGAMQTNNKVLHEEQMMMGTLTHTISELEAGIAANRQSATRKQQLGALKSSQDAVDALKSGAVDKPALSEAFAELRSSGDEKQAKRMDAAAGSVGISDSSVPTNPPMLTE